MTRVYIHKQDSIKSYLLQYHKTSQNESYHILPSIVPSLPLPPFPHYHRTPSPLAITGSTFLCAAKAMRRAQRSAQRGRVRLLQSEDLVESNASARTPFGASLPVQPGLPGVEDMQTQPWETSPSHFLCEGFQLPEHPEQPFVAVGRVGLVREAACDGGWAPKAENILFHVLRGRDGAIIIW